MTAYAEYFSDRSPVIVVYDWNQRKRRRVIAGASAMNRHRRRYSRHTHTHARPLARWLAHSHVLLFFSLQAPNWAARP